MHVFVGCECVHVYKNHVGLTSPTMLWLTGGWCLRMECTKGRDSFYCDCSFALHPSTCPPFDAAIHSHILFPPRLNACRSTPNALEPWSCWGTCTTLPATVSQAWLPAKRCVPSDCMESCYHQHHYRHYDHCHHHYSVIITIIIAINTDMCRHNQPMMTTTTPTKRPQPSTCRCVCVAAPVLLTTPASMLPFPLTNPNSDPM